VSAEPAAPENRAAIAAFLNRVDFSRDPLPVVVQDAQTREVRMVGLATRESLEMTLRSGTAHFHSRSRARSFKKGETSGAVQHIRRVWLSCDADAVVFEVEQVGDVTCHLGARTCFTHGVSLQRSEDEAAQEGPPMVPVTVGAPGNGRNSLLQRPLDSLALETHVRPLLAAYEALLRLDDEDADAPLPIPRNAHRVAVLDPLLTEIRALARVDEAEGIVAKAAGVWSWAAIGLLVEGAADAPAMAASIAQGYFAARVPTAELRSLLEGLERDLTAASDAADFRTAVLSALELAGRFMRSLDLRPYTFLDHDRRTMLARGGKPGRSELAIRKSGKRPSSASSAKT